MLLFQQEAIGHAGAGETRSICPREKRSSVGQCGWSSRRWCDYFERNRQDLLAIPWERGAELTPAERDLLVPSLQVFQQGEAQEGAHFYSCARAYAEMSGDRDYVMAHRLFMQEEQRHGRDLARFLALADIPVLTELSWMARGFCWFGSRGGIEMILLVILMSEIMGLVYYTAVGRATHSAVLLRLCAQLLRDEKQHIRFQSERLAILRRARPVALLMLNHLLDRLLFLGALVVLWLGHRGILRAGRLGPIRFWRHSWRAFRACARQKDPRNFVSRPADSGRLFRS